MEGDIIATRGKGEAALARFIADQKLFCKKIGSHYYPLNASTIETYLRNIKSLLIEEMAKERQQQKKKNQTKKKEARKS